MWVRGCAVCLWDDNFLSRKLLGSLQVWNFQRVHESPQGPGLVSLFYCACVRCELWPSLMKMTSICVISGMCRICGECVCLGGEWGL